MSVVIKRSRSRDPESVAASASATEYSRNPRFACTENHSGDSDNRNVNRWSAARTRPHAASTIAFQA
jgi:hypothetical protein